MCDVCGCGKPGHHHDHSHSHDHEHGDTHYHASGDVLHFGSKPSGVTVPGMSEHQVVHLQENLFARNNEYAEEVRKRLEAQAITGINLLSSPGAGKTSLLVQTIELLGSRESCFVIEGDQQTSNDASRIRQTGAKAVQVNTGKGCHLDAHMVSHALDSLQPADNSYLFIENVGNLVCPAGFDLGEQFRVVILSITEGEDKPVKYPDIFHDADLVLVNKIDLLPYLDFDLDRCLAYIHEINPGAPVIQVSTTNNTGMEEWLAWLKEKSFPRAHNHPDNRQTR